MPVPVAEMEVLIRVAWQAFPSAVDLPGLIQRSRPTMVAGAAAWGGGWNTLSCQGGPGGGPNNKAHIHVGVLTQGLLPLG
jgi:hypothetical protein